MTEKAAITKLHQEKTAFANEGMATDLANALAFLSRDIYTENIRFLFELVQNADDAEAEKVYVKMLPNHVVIAHNGKAFSEQDAKALCSIGAGTKRSAQNKTGYKGIGFKSVFGRSNHVAIFSQGFQFRFSDDYRHPKFPDTGMPWQIIPIWAERKEYPTEVFDLPSDTEWNVITVIAMDAAENLWGGLEELIGKGEVLLFLRHLKGIRVTGRKSMSIARVDTKGNDAYARVTIQRDGKAVSEWATRTFERIPIQPEVREALRNDKNNPEKLREAEQTEVSFAAKLVGGKLSGLPPDASLIYTYLPTKVTSFRFPFLVNGGFLTNAGREELHDDRRWNEWLMEQIGAKLADWIAMLAATEAFSDQILTLLPSNVPSGGRLAQHFHDAFMRRIEEVRFVPGRGGGLLKASDTLVDRTGLSEATFIAPEAVVEYFNATNGTDLSVDSLIRRSVDKPDRLKEFGARFFELEDLATFFTSDAFRKHHQPEQNFELIKYLHERYGSRKNSEEAERLRHLPFIYAKGKTLRPPKHICFPSKADLTDLEKEVKVIHSKVFKDLEAMPHLLKWLRELGVKEVSELGWLENEVLQPEHRIFTLNYKEDYLGLTESIYKLHQSRQLDENHYMSLGEFRLLCKDGLFRAARECYLADAYLPELPLEKTLPKLAYVSESYFKDLNIPKTELKSFFIAIRVSEDIRLKVSSGTISWNSAGSAGYRNFIDREYNDGTSNWAYHSGGFSPAHVFHKFMEYPLMDYCFILHAFAKIFFKSVLYKDGETSSLKGIKEGVILEHGWGYRKRRVVTSYPKWFFENEKCFPGLDGKLHHGKHVYVNTKENIAIGSGVLPVFDCEVLVTDDWKELFGFRERIEMEDCLLVLTQIASAADDKEVSRDKKFEQKRIGLIYAKLASELPGYSTAKREALSSWAKENKLLAFGGEFAMASELKWVKHSDRIVPKGRFRTLLVPENCPADDAFESLLRELGVNVIDKFSVQPTDKHEDEALKQRLRALVPFIALVASVRQSEELHKVLDQLTKRMDRLQLYQCSALSLVFIVDGEELPGDSMQCHRDDSTLYYTGSWSDKSILYELVPELARTLGIPKRDMDLMRLLLSNLDEIEAFMAEVGADPNELPEGVLGSALAVLMPDDEDEDLIPVSSKSHLSQAARNEWNREAREAARGWLKSKGFDVTAMTGEHSVVNGVRKDGVEHPLVIKSYRNTSFKFNIRPNEWGQLDRENAMFLVHRGGGAIEVLRLEDLLEANRDFHVQFETAQFGRNGMAQFARAFRYVRNVHFQLDAPNFRMADALDEYRFNVRTDEQLGSGADSDQLLH